MRRIFAICSGSGGVGKSTLALALSRGAAMAGEKTILLDASGVSRACDLALGLENIVALDMTDVLGGEVSMEQALYRVPQQENLRLACASLYEGTMLSDLAGIVLALQSLCERLVIDLPTGHAALESGLLGEGDARVIVLRPDDISLRAAERLLMLSSGEPQDTFIVVNRLKKDLVKKGRQYPPETVEAVLDRPILGCIPENDNMAWGVGKSGFLLGAPELHQVVKSLLKEG